MSIIEGPVRGSRSGRHRSRARAWLACPLLCVLVLTACQKSVEDRLADARLQQEIGSWLESIATLQKILEDHPEHPEANFLLGTAQLSTGQAALAIWPLEVASRDPGQADHADLALGAAYLRLEQSDAAIAAADRVLARNPEDPMLRAGALQIRAGAHMIGRNWDAVLEEVDRLLALDSESVEALNLMAQALLGAGRVDEAEAALLRIWDSPTLRDTPAAGRAGITLVKLEAYHREDLAAAERRLEALFERFPQDRGVVEFVADFLVANDREERATSLLQAALERDPGDMNLRARLADLQRRQGQAEQAEQLLVEATELFDSPQAWMTLSDFHRDQGQYAQALTAFERAIELLPGTSDLLKFRHAGLVADVGELDRAEALARELDATAYRAVMLGRIAYLRGDADGALREFDQGLREWPNNPGARYLAAKAALSKGDLERGVEELREAVRADVDATDAGLELVLLYLNTGRAATAVGMAALLVSQVERDSPRAGPARQLLARAHFAAGNEQAAREVLDDLAKLPGQEVAAAMERARIDAAKGGPAAGLRSLAAAGLDLDDPAHEAALRMLCEFEVAGGQGPRALARVDAALARHPEVAGFHDLRGRVLANLGRNDDAAAAFARALELDPEHAPALEGQSKLLLARGESERARELLDRAAAADPTNASYPHQAAQIELAAGRAAEAEQRLRETLKRDPVHAHASNDLAWILAERGQDLDLALRLATRAAEADASAAVLDTLGWVRYRRGEDAEAIAAYERARALDSGTPSIAYRLGLALLRSGDRPRAAQLFREALSGGSFPEAESARAQLAELEATS